MNRVILVGRITKDPELRYTNTNIAVVQFTLAVNRRFQNANGERQTDFINCVAWRQAAENLGKYIKKGGLLGVEGQIQTRTYDDPSGQKRYITEVICDSVNFLEPKGAQENRGGQYQPVDNGQYSQPSYNQPNPNYNNQYGQGQNNYRQQPSYNNQPGQSYQSQPVRQNPKQEQDPFENMTSDYNFSDDDLPF